MTYQSFTAREAQTFRFHVWWLKEFKNRWFAVGVKGKGKQVLTLALDRIQEVMTDDTIVYYDSDGLTPEWYYKDVIGVTVSANYKPRNVIIQVNSANAPYVETKPLHRTQRVIERNEKGIVISMRVQLNYELEREILGFGDSMVVLQPRQLRNRMRKKMEDAMLLYNSTDEDVENENPDE